MLVVMTFNLGLIISATLGSMLGALAFGEHTGRGEGEGLRTHRLALPWPQRGMQGVLRHAARRRQTLFGVLRGKGRRPCPGHGGMCLLARCPMLPCPCPPPPSPSKKNRSQATGQSAPPALLVPPRLQLAAFSRQGRETPRCRTRHSRRIKLRASPSSRSRPCC